MLVQAFEEYQKEFLSLPKNLPIAELEPKINEILKEFQVKVGMEEPYFTIANLFVVRVNGTNPDTQSLELPNGLNLTYLSQDPSGRKFPGYINQMDIVFDKIVDPVTREMYLMPWLVQNFSKPFKINYQMLELIDNLSCADGSRPKLDADSLNKTSAEFVDYLRRFQAADLPPNAAPMSLKEMYGILQSFEKFKLFGSSLKQPSKKGACSQDRFGSTSQSPKFGLNYELEGKFYGVRQEDGNIRFSSEGIKRLYTIYHEILHMGLPGKKFYKAGLIHIDDFKFLKPLLGLSDNIPITASNKYSPAIPNQYAAKGVIGFLDHLFFKAAESLGRPSALPSGCNSPFIGPSSVFSKFCPANIGPTLAMTIPYNSQSIFDALMAPQPQINPPAPAPATTTPTPTPTQLNQSSNSSLIDPMIMIEFYTALSRGALQIIATNLNLSKEKQEVLLSLGENASRIGFTAYNENKIPLSLIPLSVISSMTKIADSASKSFLGDSLQEFAQECIGKFSKIVIGEEITNKIGNAIGNTPEQLKKFTSQLLFVFALHSLSDMFKNIQEQDSKTQPPKLEERMLIGFLASACSALTGVIINLGVDKFFSRSRTDSATNEGAEVPGGDVENSTQGRVNSAREANRSIEISGQIVMANLGSPAPAPQSPSGQSTPSIQRRE
jgi:hypothetical protein